MTLEAFQSMVFPVKNKLYRFAYRLLGNNEEAKDVVQEVFIKVWNGRDQLSEVENMEAWCMRITKNLSLDRLRQQQRRPTDSIDMGMHVSTNGLSPAETTELSESMKRIAALMNQLPEKQRQVMHLRDIEGYSYHEICEIMEIDMSQVKVSLFRARNAVREKLQKIDAYGLA
ncbi:MAG: sigma-70 family RNA polymerase sigma factor [Cyclobacteriaceae bacterium]|nr:sigma-70 family RNA polymerase sigma factor [Cyclobacteriaceae bacterium]